VSQPVAEFALEPVMGDHPVGGPIVAHRPLTPKEIRAQARP
jgi:hypothetical protein